MIKLLFVCSILLIIVSVYGIVDYERRLTEKSDLLMFDQLIIEDQREQIEELKEKNRIMAEYLFGAILDGKIGISETGY